MSDKEPIFKSIFGASWESLPDVMKKHYANRPNSDDRVEVIGKIDTFCAGPIKWMSSLFWLMKGIPPHSEKDISVKVSFGSDRNTECFYFNRIFNFKNRKPYNFFSRMVQIKDSEVIEIMRYGFGWRMDYSWEDGKVKLKHKGYVFHLLGVFIPLPLSLFIGEGYAEEVPIDDNTFDMMMQIVHPLWGKVYEYKGQFKILGIELNDGGAVYRNAALSKEYIKIFKVIDDVEERANPQNYVIWREKASLSAKRKIDRICELYQYQPLSAIRLSVEAVLSWPRDYSATKEVEELFYSFLDRVAAKEDNSPEVFSTIELVLGIYQSFIDQDKRDRIHRIPRGRYFLTPVYVRAAKTDPQHLSSVLRGQTVSRPSVVGESETENLSFGAYPIFLYEDSNLSAWHDLSHLLFLTDPSLTKSILMGILKTRNHDFDGRDPAENMDYRFIAQGLFDYDSRSPEISNEGKFHIFSTLVNYGFPDAHYWEEILEKAFNFARTTNMPYAGHINLMASIAFYADINGTLKECALSELEIYLQDQFNFECYKNYVSRAYAQILVRLSEFCTQNKNFLRNRSFASNKNDPLRQLVHKVFWGVVEEKLAEFSLDAFVFLHEAMKGDDESLSRAAAEKFINSFGLIVVHNPVGISVVLREMADSSLCIYSRSDTKHQNDLLVHTFDAVIDLLYDVDRKAALEAYKGFMRSHSAGPPHWFAVKHKMRMVCK